MQETLGPVHSEVGEVLHSSDIEVGWICYREMIS